jgi:predicted RNA-binding Zn-ribbon protein involved in translation (DUF1610 family)
VASALHAVRHRAQVLESQVEMEDEITDRRRIPYDYARYTCPTCGSLPDKKCRTLTTNKTTDAHQARMNLVFLGRHSVYRPDHGGSLR